MPVQVQVQLSGYVVASVWGGNSANYSYPLYYDVGAPVQDHFLNFKVPAPHSQLQEPCKHDTDHALASFAM